MTTNLTRKWALLALLGVTACRDGITSTLAPATSGADVVTLSITPGTVPSLALGRAFLLEATARDSSGKVLASAHVFWSTSEPQVAQLQPVRGFSKSALLYAMRAGTATITATSGAKTASVTIFVHAPGPVATVSVATIDPLAVGRTAKVTVVQLDSDGVVLTGPVPSLSISDSTVALLTSSGLLIARASGTATVTATSGGKSGSRSITVVAAEHAFLWTAAAGMVDVGVLPGFVSSRANAVSAAGHVAGTMSTVADSLSHAFVRSPGTPGELRDLGGLPGGGNSEAFGVNSTGQVVGYAVTITGARRAVLWRSTGEIVEIAGAASGLESVANGINDAGQVVGWVGSGGGTQAFAWTEAGGIRILPGTGTGIGTGMAFAINQAGVVAGELSARPVVWNVAAASATVLPILQGDISGSAHAISNGGALVGSSSGCDDYYSYYYDDCTSLEEHPVMWDGVNAAADLRGPSGSAIAVLFAFGINSDHQVVGVSTAHHAILFSPAGGLRDLGALPGRQWSVANAINDAGTVVGRSYNP